MYTGSGRLQEWTGEEGGTKDTGSGRLKQWTGEGVGAMYTGSGRLQQGAGEAAGIRYTGSGRLKQWTGEAGGIAYTGSGRISGHGDSAAARSQTSSSLPSGKLSFGAGGAGSGIAAESWSVGRHTNGVLAAKVRAQLEDASNEFVSEWRASHGGNTYSSSSGSSAQQGGEVLEARASAGVAAAACSSAPHPSGDGCGSEHNGGAAAAAAAESAGGDEASGSSSSSTTTPPGRSTSTPPPPGLASSSVAVVVEVGQPKVDVVVVAPSCPTLPPVNLHKWLHQLRVLLWREGLMITRNPADAAGRMLTCMFTALLVGVVFLALTDNGDAYQARLGCVFVSVLFVVLLPFVNMGLILGDSWLLIRESAENAYSPSACYVARLAINTVLNSCNAIVFASVAYGLVGLRRGAAHVWISNGILTLCHLILCQVMAIGAVWTPTQDMAFMVAVAIVATFILLANFLIRWQEMTWAWVAALRFLSPLYYAFGSLVENEFKDRMLPCPSARSTTTSSITTHDTTIEWGSSVEGGPGTTSAAPGSLELPCIPNGNLIVSWYTNYSLGTTFAVLVAWWVGLHCITYAGMRWRIWQLRGN